MNYPEIVEQLTLEEKIRLVTGYGSWHTYPVERLGIESIMMTDGPIGLRKVDEGETASHVSVCFPSGCLTACSFDRDLLEKMGETLGEECQAYEVGMILGPAINIKRSPLCGRNFEYYSEDPYLTGEVAAAYIKGVQSKGVGTSLKHYAMNNQEYRRMSYDAIVDERAMREIYLAGYETAVKKSQPTTLMCSYNLINGEHASESKKLLTDILRDEWGFQGAVISDWGAVHYRDKGLAAGLDLEMPGNNWANQGFIRTALADGTLTIKELDTCVDRIITLVKRIVKHPAKFDFEKDHDLTRRIAEESIVLLKNKNNILPLAPETKVAVLGEFAVKPRIQGGGSAFINCYGVDITLDQLKGRGNVTYSKAFPSDGDTWEEAELEAAVACAKEAEVAVVMAGLPDVYESEGFDRTHIHLPEAQNLLIRKLTDLGIPTVVVLQNGAVVDMPWADAADAIVEAYLAGEGSGTAIARILYGEVNPSGKLAETFPLQLEDNPSYLNFPGDGYSVRYAESIYVGYRYYQKKRMNVLFPFGYGLSYTTFSYSNLRLDRSEMLDTDELNVTVDVTNTGNRFGKEIVQLYVSDKGDQTGRPQRPVRELKEFAKVALEPGETKTVSFRLSKRSFAYYEEQVKDWLVPTSEYAIEIGASSKDIRLSETVKITATKTVPLKIRPDTVFGELLRDPRTKQYTLDNLIKQEASGILSFSPEAIAALMDHNPIRGLRNFSNQPPQRVDEIMVELKKLAGDTD
ncbi:MAG: glycoside hydrolase family 3 C-terminal domain-containing protein [Oscillospiraceae bacterium]|nr:glycoside hydrolase family 3 C-terminal domain-containing protein [Oscillospiraceae bacterium]